MRRCTVCLSLVDDSEAHGIQGHPVCRNCLALSAKLDTRVILLTLGLVLALLVIVVALTWWLTRR